MKGSMQAPPLGKSPLLGISIEDDDDGGDSEVGAAKDILEAIADKDPDALNLALKRHYELCEASKGSKDEPDDEDEDEE